MATTPVSVSTSSFNWQSLIPLLELAGNTVVAILVPGGPVLVPLIAALENSINPLLLGIGQKQNVANDVMAAYGTLVAVLNIVKQTTGVSPAILAKVEEYLAAVQNAMAAFVKAGQGYDPTLYGTVVPIA